MHFLHSKHRKAEYTCLFSVFKSRPKHSYFVGLGPLASTHNRLPPAPRKLRPYGALALQICLLLLFYTLGIYVPDGGLNKIRENEKAGYV